MSALVRAATSHGLASLRGLSRYRMEFVGATAGPLIWVAGALLTIHYARQLGLGDGFERVTGLTGARAAAYFLAGAVYWNYVEGVWSLAMGVRGSMRAGTLESLWATPAPRLAMILGWSAGGLAAVSFQSVAGFALLLVLAGGSIAGWSLAAGVLIASVLAAYGMAFVLAGLTLRFKDAESILGMVGNAAPLLGGVIFPVALLPMPLRVASYLFPFTYGADAVRAAALGSRTLFDLRAELAVIAAMSVLLPLAGWRLFLRIEKASRLRGLEGF
ncbi:MAG: ABC transporter permease [Acidobacteria bacterium]|nr:ABC transporter permease [Acidobacteriota bacterium]